MIGYMTLEWTGNETAERIARKYGKQIRIFAQLLDVVPKLKTATTSKIARALIEKYEEKAPCRDSIRKYLTILEKEGLVEIERKPGKGWRVTWKGGEGNGQAGD